MSLKKTKASERERATTSEVVANIETITPEKAGKMRLAGNLRKPARQWVSKYAAAMKAGRWEVNGCSIKIGTSGRVLDGQHRLMACVEAGVPFTTVVMYDVPENDLYTNTGRMGSVSQILSAQGVKTPNVVQSVARMVQLYLLRGTLDPPRSNDGLPDIGEQREFCEHHLKSISESVEATKPGKAMVQHSAMASLHWILGQYTELNALKDSFFAGLISGVMLGETDPRLHLRTRCEYNKMRNVRDSRRTLTALLVKAWNAYYEGRPVRQLKLRSDEEFPSIAGIDK